jgi:hypothetical protein
VLKKQRFFCSIWLEKFGHGFHGYAIRELRGLFFFMDQVSDRPAGITWIGILFLLAAAYLAGAGTVMFVRPGWIPLTSGSSFLGGLELAGSYMFFLVCAVSALIGWGLFRLNAWARRTAIAAAFAGVVLLVPSVSGSVISFRAGALFWGALGVIVRVVVIWYLFQEPVKEEFLKRAESV